MKRLTVTIDDIANEVFPQLGQKTSGYLDILERLQRRLQDKGDDPRYQRVIFTTEGQDKYVEIKESDVRLAGVFPRVSARRYEYGSPNTLRNSFFQIESDILVVADSEKIAKIWEEELSSQGYSTRLI